MNVLKLKKIGRIDYSMCFIKPPLYDKLCVGWINGKKLDKRLYFDDDFWCLSPYSREYLRNMGLTDYIIEVDGAVNKDNYCVMQMLEEEDLPVMKPECENVGSIEEQINAILDAVGG